VSTPCLQTDLIKSTSAVWVDIARMLGRDASLFAQLTPTQMEELVAGAYERVGYKVILHLAPEITGGM
jgi:restriction system protein